MSKLAKSEITKHMSFILPGHVILIWFKSNCPWELSKRPLDVTKKLRNPDLNRICNEKCQEILFNCILNSSDEDVNCISECNRDEAACIMVSLWQQLRSESHGAKSLICSLLYSIGSEYMLSQFEMAVNSTLSGSSTNCNEKCNDQCW